MWITQRSVPGPRIVVVVSILLWQGYLGRLRARARLRPSGEKGLFTSPSASTCWADQAFSNSSRLRTASMASWCWCIIQWWKHDRTLLQGMACLALGAEWIRRDHVKTLLFRYGDTAPPPSTPMGKVASRSTLSEPVQEAHQGLEWAPLRRSVSNAGKKKSANNVAVVGRSRR